MTLRLVARPSGLLIPVDEFKLKGVPSGDLTLGDDIQYSVALNLGHDGNQPRLLQVDANRLLKVTTVGGVLSSPDTTGVAHNINAELPNGDLLGASSRFALDVLAFLAGFNGTQWDRLRTASAANLAALSGLGALLSAPPGQWSVNSSAAVGSASSASRAAGGAGVRHVFTGGDFAFSATTALAAITTVTVNLRDGATGAGTILKSWQFTLPAATIAPFLALIPPCEIVGSANTAMTLEFAAGIGNLLTSCNLAGHDAS